MRAFGKPSRISCTRAHLLVHGDGTALGGFTAGPDARCGAVDDEFVPLPPHVAPPQGRDLGVRQARGNQRQDQRVAAPEESRAASRSTGSCRIRLLEDVGDGLQPLVTAGRQRSVDGVGAAGF